MPTNDVLRLEIQKRLSALLGTITVANGYSADFNVGNVFRGRTVYGANDPLPMLSILEVPIPLDQLPPPVDAPLSSGGWELMVQGFVVDDKENPTDPAHPILADVKKCLAIERKKATADEPEDGILGLGNSVTRILIGPGVVRPPDEISAKAYFWLTVQLDLVEDLSDPFGINA